MASLLKPFNRCVLPLMRNNGVKSVTGFQVQLRLKSTETDKTSPATSDPAVQSKEASKLNVLNMIFLL
jgi:hypothetical protein